MTNTKTANHLLAALSDKEFDRLLPDPEPYPLVLGDLLYSPGESMSHVYFPELGVISMVTVMKDGRGVEAATVGSEGMAGLSVFFGQPIATFRWIVQVADGSYRIPSARFLEILETMPGLRSTLGRYASALIDLVAQSAACNAIYSLTERCARWLLLTHDRMNRTDFHLTQEFLAQMLGVHRPSVTVAVGKLQAAGHITYHRGRVQLLDRSGLEGAVCECYETNRLRFNEV